jgi:hypothetical protein
MATIYDFTFGIGNLMQIIQQIYVIIIVRFIMDQILTSQLQGLSIVSIIINQAKNYKLPLIQDLEMLHMD